MSAKTEKLVDVAMGNCPADVVIKGGKLINVLTKEIYPADVAILGDTIAAVGDVDYTIGKGTQVIDATGKYLTPGMIDEHVHYHESQMSIPVFAQACVPRGTTAVVTDFYGDCNIGGKEAVRACLEMGKKTPLEFLFALPICAYYQHRPFEYSGTPSREDMIEMLHWPECIGSNDTYGAMMANKNPLIMDIVDEVIAAGKKVLGHGSELTGRALQAMACYAQDTDDHEAVTREEAAERARLGIRVASRDGSGCCHVVETCRAVTELGLDSRMFTASTDLISPAQIVREGMQDATVRHLIASGVPIIDAIQMVTINPAESLRVSHKMGAIVPGKLANICIVGERLAEFNVEKVVAKGRLVAEHNKLIVDLPACAYPDACLNSVKFPRPITADDFKITAKQADGEVKANVIIGYATLFTTDLKEAALKVKDHVVQNDVPNDILKIAAIERVRGTGEIGVAYLTGYGIKRGALATTYNSQAQNMIILGTNDEDMAFAANTLKDMGGGWIAVENGKVLASCPMAYNGLESSKSLEEILVEMDETAKAARDLGCDFPAAFHMLGFVGLAVTIGNYKICTKGLVDSWAETVMPVIKESEV